MKVELTVNISIEVPDGTDANSLTLGIPLDRVTVFSEAQPVTHAIVKGYETTNVDVIE